MRPICLTLIAIFYLGLSAIQGQSKDKIFNASPSTMRMVSDVCAVPYQGKWVSIRSNDGKAFINFGNSEKEILGLDMNNKQITGFSIAEQTGLIAYSIAPSTAPIQNKYLYNEIGFAKLEEDGIVRNYFKYPSNSKYSVTTPHLSKDGTKMYMASDIPGGFGGFDIYVMDYRGKAWSQPRNLGSNVNSVLNELHPFNVSGLLFFSSNGLGSNDYSIYMSDLDHDHGTVVISSGLSNQVAGNLMSFTYDEQQNKGFFMAGLGSETKCYEVNNQNKLMIFNIKSLQSRNKLGGAKLDLSRCRKNSIIVNSEGSAILPVPPGEDCFINVGKIGYSSTSVMVDYNDIKGLKKAVNIFLPEEGIFYTGRIIDQLGNTPENIRIDIIDQANGDQQTTFSNTKGQFSAALEPLGHYLIRVISPFYEPKEVKLATSASIPSNVIGSVDIRTKGNLSKSINQHSEVQKIEEVQRISTQDSIELAQKSKIEKESGINMSTSNELTDNLIKYSIQLAAVSGTNVDLSSYKTKLAGKGQIYSEVIEGRTKIKLGFFNSREEAKTAQNQLPEEFKSSFIVTESLQKNDPRLFQSGKVPITQVEKKNKPEEVPFNEPKSGTKEIKNSTSTSVTIPPPIEKMEQSKSEFKIRLSTLKDPRLFNGSKIKQYGLVEEVKSGNLITFYLVGFESKEEAEKILPKVKEAGFPTAHLVELVGGEYRKL